MLEISRMLTISTVHISKKTAERLTFGNPHDLKMPAYFEKGDYGWFVFVPRNYLDVHSNGDHEESYQNAPDDLRDCMREAWLNNCEWLCLDCDGLEVDDLPKYDW